MVAPTLAPELIQHICDHLCSSDLLSMRAASQAFASIATPGAFRSVSFRVVPESTDPRIALLGGALSHIIGYIRLVRIAVSQRRGSGFYAVELIRQLEGLIQPKKIECVHEVEPTPLSFGELEGHPLEYILYFFGGSHRPVHIPITLRDDLNPGTVVHIMRSTRQIERSDAGFRFNGLPRWVFSALNDGLLDSIAYTDCLISVHYLQIPWRSGAISSITLHETYISEGAGKWSVIYDAICRLCRRLTDLHVRGCGYAREETSRNWVKIPQSEIDAAILEKDRIALDRLFQTVAENQGGTA